LFPQVLKLLKKKHASKIKVIGGGIIPADDMKRLEKMGVKKLFGPGTPTGDIINWINQNSGKKSSKPKTRKTINKHRKKSKKSRK